MVNCKLYTESINCKLLGLYKYDVQYCKHSVHDVKLDGLGPIDNRPSTVEAPPIGKIHQFSKLFNQKCNFGALQYLESPQKLKNSLVYD